METKKCSSEEHREKDAIFCCVNCRINMCNKCDNFHSKLFANHKVFPLDKNTDEIFTGVCKEKSHNNNILNYFCKTHNILCCAECICKIKNDCVGKHHDCEIVLIENIKEEKINILKNNIKYLEDLSNNIIKSLEEIKIFYENMNKNKEDLEKKIMKIFTEIRTQINKREDELLSEIDIIYDKLYFKDELIKESEKLINKIKLNIEKGKETEKKNNNNLNYIINECINIENNIKYINNIYRNVEKNQESMDINIIFNNNKEKELKEIIKSFGKIELQKDYSYKDFNIKNIKEPIHNLNFHTDYIHCLTVLNDRRLVSSSNDHSIIIYNKITFKPDLIIKEHMDRVCCVIQLSSGELVTCSNEIIIFKINDNKYETLQRTKIIEYKDLHVLKLIQLKNKNLVSCSNSYNDGIIFYDKDNLGYKIKEKIKTNGGCYTLIQTKENEICYSEGNNNAICFYDFIEKKIKSSFKISKICRSSEEFIMISKDLLLVPGENVISIVNVNEYKIINSIKVPGSSWILGVCLLTDNIILTGDYSKTICQWKIEGDNLVLISKKENAHKGNISVLCKLGNGHLASASDDSSIYIW